MTTIQNFTKLGSSSMSVDQVTTIIYVYDDLLNERDMLLASRNEIDAKLSEVNNLISRANVLGIK